MLTTPSPLYVPNERPFQPYRCNHSKKSKELVQDILREYEAYENDNYLRKRTRKAADQTIFEETVTAIITDIVHRYLEEPEGSVSVSLSNRILGVKSRYRAPALGKKLPAIIRTLSTPQMDYLRLTKGMRSEILNDDLEVSYERRQSTIRSSQKLKDKIISLNLQVDDFSLSNTGELIILRDTKTHPKYSGRKLEYDDTKDTDRYRQQLRSINNYISNADILLDQYSSEVPINTNSCRMVRTFNNASFNQGARLSGGFWMHLNRVRRRENLFINDEPIAELDYGQMALRSLYGMAGIKPPDGDLYSIPKFIDYRKGVKTIINSALFANTMQNRMPQGVRKHIPNRIKYADVLQAIIHYHSPIKDYLFKGIGMELMFIESEIMISLLLRLQELSIVALPIHDSVLVPQSTKQTVKRVMEEVFLLKTGTTAVVSIEKA
ncbi:MAG: hypothetical protein V7751_22135 [Pseudoalteromonas distincta]